MSGVAAIGSDVTGIHVGLPNEDTAWMMSEDANLI